MLRCFGVLRLVFVEEPEMPRVEDITCCVSFALKWVKVVGGYVGAPEMPFVSVLLGCDS